jgi:hypothetical protein
MPRIRKKPMWPIALSPAAAAECLGIPRQTVMDAVKNLELQVFQKGLARRILTLDLEKWVRETWKKGELPSWHI